MIIVNVRVPAIETVYNFSLEEKAKVRDLIEEITELIAQKEGVPFHGNLEEMILCSVENGEQCGKDNCLNDYGIVGGAELILT